MLKATIRNTQFTTEIADELFRNITGDQYAGDNALLSVARAILPRRMSEGDSVHFRHTAKCIRPGTPFDGTSEECEASIARELDLDSHELVTIYFFSGVRREDSAQYMEAIQEHFVSKHRGWEENEKVRQAYGQSFPICAYVNRELRNAVVFMGEMDMTRYRCGIMAAFSSMPWYFDRERHPMTDDEQVLLNCLTEKGNNNESEQKFKDAIGRIASQYDFEKIRVGRMLDGFETRYERRAIESVEMEIRRNDERIDNLNDQIKEQLRKRRESEIRLCGLKMRLGEAGEASAVKDLFLNNPRLYLDSVSDDSIVFAVKTDVEYVDTEQLEKYLANHESWVYRGGYTERSKDMAKLLRAIFIDNTIRLQVCGGYHIELSGCASAIQHYNFPDGFSDYMPNTHIQEYRCIGNHEIPINECIRSGDYVGAIMQCIASCQSLNVGDYTVMEKFARFMYEDKYAGLRLPDGRVVKPSAAIAWLKEQEAQDGQEEQEAPAEAEA